MFKIVEKKNHNAIHGLFDTYRRAEQYLALLANATKGICKLRAEDFEIVEVQRPRDRSGQSQ